MAKFPLRGRKPIPIKVIFMVAGELPMVEADRAAKALQLALDFRLSIPTPKLTGGLTLWSEKRGAPSRALFHWGQISADTGLEEYLREKVAKKYGFCVSRVVNPNNSAWRTHTVDDPGPFDI